MGKRKASKTAKKKQAKAASRSKNAKSKTTAFGVSVVKGSKGRGRQDFGNSVSVTSGKQSHTGSQTPLVQTTTKSASSSSPAGFGSQKFASSRDDIKQRQRSNDEQRHFDRELASLQERVDVKGQKRCNARNKRNKKYQQRVQGQGSTGNALFGNLDDSSIKMGPATVGEMVDDAADKVATGMSDIGRQVSSPMNSAPSVPPNTPSVPRARFGLMDSQSAPHEHQQQQGTGNNLLQVLAAKKKAEWSAQKYMIQPETNGQGNQDSSMGDNRFAFLDNGDSDDDDDNGWGANGDAAVGINFQPPAFQFAPASFAATTTSTTGSAHGNTSAAVDDVDPDL